MDFNPYEEEDLVNIGRRLKPKGKRRRLFVIEIRYPEINGSRFPRFMGRWHTWKSYETKTRRDQAFAALVKKTSWGGLLKVEYRKVDR